MASELVSVRAELDVAAFLRRWELQLVAAKTGWVFWRRLDHIHPGHDSGRLSYASARLMSVSVIGLP